VKEWTSQHVSEAAHVAAGVGKLGVTGSVHIGPEDFVPAAGVKLSKVLTSMIIDILPRCTSNAAFCVAGSSSNTQ
jgi:hypothetical protein